MFSRNYHFPFIILAITAALFVLPSTSVYAAGIVGNGTPASCTETALKNAIAGGGSVTFNCGGAATITITQEIVIQQGSTVIDGGNNITLTASPGVRVFYLRTWGTLGDSFLTLRNMTITGTTRTGSKENANGAAVYVHSQSANPTQDIPTLTVENVTFTNNISNQTDNSGNPYDYGGGAIYVRGAVANISDSTFTGNRSNKGAGGAIHILASNLRVQNSTFTGNVATATSTSSKNSGYGGAIYVDGTFSTGGGSIIILDSTFTNNSAANQGGFAYINLYPSRESYLYIDRSQFIGNTVSGGGMGTGGALSGGGTGGSSDFLIANSVFKNNSVARATNQGGSGGALGLSQPTNTTIVNSTFMGNRAEGVCSNCTNANGGAIYFVNNPTPVQIINSTIVNNYAGWVGGGITGSSAVLKNTIIANNSADNGGNGWGIQQQCSAEVTNGGGNIQYPNRNPNPNFWNEVICAPNITITNPLLKPELTANNGMPYLAPRHYSPAINAGSNSAFNGLPINFPNDQISNTRIQDGTVDIGAVEAPPFDQNSLPQIINTIPAQNAIGVGVDENLFVTFSETLWGNGAGTSFTCNGQTISFAVSLGENNTYELNPNSTLPTESTCTLAVPVTSLTDTEYNYMLDNDGNPDGTYRLTFETVGIPPEITSISPIDGATDVPTNATIDATFTELVRAVGEITFGCQPGGETFTLSVTLQDLTYIATPSDTLPPSSTCTLTIPTDNLEDLRGNKLVDTDSNPDANYVLTFDTEPALQIDTISPADGDMDVPVDTNLVVTFNEPLRGTDAGITFECPADGQSFQLNVVNVDGNTYTLDPGGDLPYETDCTLTIPTTSITDATNNPLVDNDGVDDSDGSYTLTFTTAAEVINVEAAQNPEISMIEVLEEVPVVIESTSGE